MFRRNTCATFNSECRDKASVHYFCFHMTQTEFEQLCVRKKTSEPKIPFKLNMIDLKKMGVK